MPDPQEELEFLVEPLTDPQDDLEFLDDDPEFVDLGIDPEEEADGPDVDDEDFADEDYEDPDEVL